MKVLLTGSTGTAGGNLLRSGIFGRHELICTVRETQPEIAGQRTEFVSCDLLADDLSKTIPSDIDAVVHAAAMAPKHAQSPVDYQHNPTMAQKICDYACAQGIKHVVYLSTGSVYGEHAEAYHENAVCRPSDDYGKSQHQAEEVFLSAAGELNVAVLRLFYPYGFDRWTEQNNFIAKLFRRVQNQMPLTIGTNSDQIRFRPILMADANAVVKWVIDNRWSGILNIAGPDAVSLRQMLTMMGEIAGVKPDISVKDGMPAPFPAETAKLHNMISGLAMTPFRKGLELLAKTLN